MEIFQNIEYENLEDKAYDEKTEQIIHAENSEENDLSNDESNSKEEPKKIEVINGNGDLNISPVSDYLEVEKPKPKDNRTIIIPEVKDNVTESEESKKEDEKIQKNSKDSEN